MSDNAAERTVEDDLRDYGVAYQWVEEGKPVRRLPPENVVRVAMKPPADPIDALNARLERLEKIASAALDVADNCWRELCRLKPATPAAGALTLVPTCKECGAPATKHLPGCTDAP